MSIRKLKDWRGWWDGMRSAVMKAGAGAIMTNTATLIGTNGVAATIPQLDSIRMHWQTALCAIGVQFGMHVLYAGAKYVFEKPDPDVVEQEFATEHVTKP
jgi:hypothetical protein